MSQVKDRKLLAVFLVPSTVKCCDTKNTQLTSQIIRAKGVV